MRREEKRKNQKNTTKSSNHIKLEIKNIQISNILTGTQIDKNFQKQALQIIYLYNEEFQCQSA